MLEGTLRKDRDNTDAPEYASATGDHPAPAWLLREEAIAQWDRLLPQILPVLTEPDLDALGQLCYLRGELHFIAANALPCPPASFFAQLRAYEAEFGLTPSSRTRVKVTHSGPSKENPFANRRRPA